MKFIDLHPQYKQIEHNILNRFADICENTRFIMGKEVKEIEDSLAHFTGAKHAISCASGTDALQLALMALELQPGDEIITSPFTFFATGEVIALLQLKPVFIDINPDTYNINPDLIESKITNRTRAIVPVSLYGQCPDIDAINKIAGKHQLPVIEDAAQSFGAHYHDRMSCNLSTLATASFFPSKPLGCYGDGGMVFTNDNTLDNILRSIRNHGQEKRYQHVRLGVNSRMDTMQAAVLLEKIKIFPKELKARQHIGSRYTEALKHHVKTPVVRDGRTHVYAQYTIEVDRRDEFCQSMKAHNIPTAIHYPIPLHFQPVFKNLGFSEGDFPVSETVAKHVVSLPMHPYLNERDQDLVIEGVLKSLKVPA